MKCLSILLLANAATFVSGRRTMLGGLSGSLNPHHDFDKDGDCNKAKLYVEFDNTCATTKKQVKNAYQELVDDFSDCLYDDKHKFKTNIYYIQKTQSYHGYVFLKQEGCEDNITLNYSDYCISEFDYEPVYEVDASCSSESSYVNSVYLYHTDIIDDSTDSTYNYVSGSNNNVDLFVLDTGVLSTHEQFSDVTVIHLDSSFGDSSIAGYHGTHVAGIAGGKNTGTFKHAGFIYEYPACRNGWTCSWEDIENSLIYTINKLKENPSRRGVINMSFGGSSTGTWRKEFYENYFEQMIENGGIPVSSAGNSAQAVCDGDTYYTPTGADNCISVGSYTSSLSVSSFSNYGECVDVYGPGSSVYSAKSDSYVVDLHSLFCIYISSFLVSLGELRHAEF